MYVCDSMWFSTVQELFFHGLCSFVWRNTLCSSSSYSNTNTAICVRTRLYTDVLPSQNPGSLDDDNHDGKTKGSQTDGKADDKFDGEKPGCDEEENGKMGSDKEEDGRETQQLTSLVIQ